MSNFWLNAAKGRATIRNRAMRKARLYKSLIGQPQHHYHSPERTDADLRRMIRQSVATARQAHHDWLRYRRMNETYLGG